MGVEVFEKDVFECDYFLVLLLEHLLEGLPFGYSAGGWFIDMLWLRFWLLKQYRLSFGLLTFTY